MAQAIATFTTVVGLSKLAHIKENKLYRALAGRKVTDANGAEITDVGTWAGFCRMIGSSQQTIDERLENRRILGEDALDNLNRIGAGYRELRALRKLPEDERALIAAAPDRESLVELLEERAAAHAKEKEQLTAELTEAQATAEDKQARIGVLSTKLEKTEADLSKAKRRWRAATPDEQRADLERAVNEAALAVRVAIATDSDDSGLRGAVKALAEHAVEHNLDVGDFLGDLFAQLLTAVRVVRDDETLPIAIPLRRNEEG
jgi:chromosome segregation ATPase